MMCSRDTCELEGKCFFLAIRAVLENVFIFKVPEMFAVSVDLQIFKKKYFQSKLLSGESE